MSGENGEDTVVRRLMKDDDDDSDEDNESSKFHCNVCKITASGYKSYAAHLKGRNHNKNLKKLKLKEKLGEVQSEKKNQENTSEDDSLEKPYGRCPTCQKEFNGPESLNLHLKSAAHKKKEKEIKTKQELKSKYGEGLSDDDELFKKCEVCQKSFSGPISYQIHMKSGVHSKNLERKKVAEIMKVHYISDGENSGYICKECKKTFTDPLAFKSHLANNSHEKLRAKKALAEFLTAHPEIIFTTPLDKGDCKGSDAEDSESDYYLICKLCHMSFSGPESGKDHVKSKKHISAKKEKLFLRQLKERKSPTDKQGDGGNMKSSVNPDNIRNGTAEKNENPENADDFEVI